MKIVICTTPIRPMPTSYPPFGSMAIIQSLRGAGYDPYFYDIDGLRPTPAQVEEFFRSHQPDVVGISAVVSTAYAYTRDLARMLRRVAPRARLVVGGNLAASAEILHRLAGIDVCVVGEGETIAVNLMRCLESGGDLSGVKGISYLRADGEMVFTGYETKLSPEEVFKPDYTILERYSRIENYITDPRERADFSADPRAAEPRRRGKKMATLVTAKGCVARCTFCHRWDKGYRAIPVEQIVSQVKRLGEKYGVGFITFTDENFGSDRRQAEELIAALAPLDILWQVGGVRVRSVDLDLLKRMKAAGCVAVYYGMETGSEKILKVMEKNATVQNNLDAARWTHEAGLFTIFQIVLAMPGENGETVRETTEFLKTVTQRVDGSLRARMSINYIQALPGTPVYEYARSRGLIGRSLQDEERYLLSISDVNAGDDTKFLNFTGDDYLTARAWRHFIVLDVLRHYLDHNRTPLPSAFALMRQALSSRLRRKSLDPAGKAIDDYNKGGYFNLSRNLGYEAVAAYAYPFRHLIVGAWLLQHEVRSFGMTETARHLAAWFRRRFLGPAADTHVNPMSLRKTMNEIVPAPATPTEIAMRPLREGR